MHTTVTLLVDHHPVAIERVLQVARYRGFNVVGMNLTRDSELEQRLVLEIASERNIELLVKQLAKIYHVRELKVGAEFQLAARPTPVAAARSMATPAAQVQRG
ncbi:acetolactate synthase 2 small subunit [Pseudidiomarina sp. YC-516-91]|uniref:acetolactate synthase 2 small subunit n=1 Tax=Pseudidiomarina salilacus TaxID=3384452 RepID=UPI0039853497